MKKPLSFIFAAIAVLVSYGAGLPGDTKLAGGAEPQSLHKRYVRIVTLQGSGPSNNWTSRWMLTKGINSPVKTYYAEDVLEWIRETKPFCLERFITSYQNEAGLVPTRPGNPEMTVKEFLNASIQAGGEGCHICPKLDLTWLGSRAGTTSGSNSTRTFWEGAQKLYDMDLVTPIRCISLDCWDTYMEYLQNVSVDGRKLTEAEQSAAVKTLFDSLRAIGYEEIGVNMTGAYGWAPVADIIDFVNFNLGNNPWIPNLGTALRENASIRKNSGTHDTFLLYIDYPGPMGNFIYQNNPDQMADAYMNKIWPEQSKQGFVFVYSLSNNALTKPPMPPLSTKGWDPFQYVTDADGPWGGKNMYEVTKDCLFRME